MRLNGWMRIAIVLSTVWMIGGFFYYSEMEQQLALRISNMEFETPVELAEH